MYNHVARDLTTGVIILAATNRALKNAVKINNKYSSEPCKWVFSKNDPVNKEVIAARRKRNG